MPVARALLLLVVLAAPAAAERGAGAGYFGDLRAVFVPVRQLEGTWEVLHEAPTDPDRDPGMKAQGVRAVRTQHYTRYAGPISQVCSVEIWAFVTPARAASVERGLRRADWRFILHENLVIMLRARTLERRVGTTKTLFEDCARIGELTRARAMGLH